MEAYAGNRAEAVQVALETDVFATSLMEFIQEVGSWEGTATELFEKLEDYTSEPTRKTRAWPKTAQGLGRKLTRCATFLRQVGIQVERQREGKPGKRTIRISRQNIVSNVSLVSHSEESQRNAGLVADNTADKKAKSPIYCQPYCQPEQLLKPQVNNSLEGEADNTDKTDIKKPTYSKILQDKNVLNSSKREVVRI